MNVRRNDTVQVISGKDAGKRGVIQQVNIAKDRVMVEGVNLVKKNQKPSGDARQAGIIQMEAPLHVSKVRLICPNCDKAVRIGHTYLDDGRKVRVCKACKEMVDS
ncbi:MAG: large subunit ribosomal protein L24 [Chloroflexi bacterium]|jgi:large subunit ribosomal protein L24|nr:MAG: large subunit ribosomal protein L24 [Chloroflexota bacterium]